MSSDVLTNYINGQWVDADRAGCLDVENPTTGEILAKVPLSTPAEVGRAVDAAAAAFEGWSRTPVARRVQPLYKLVERVRRDVIDALLDWKLPSGDPVVARARPREEVYRGPFVDRAPDIVVELALDHGYSLSLVQTPWARQPSSVQELGADELAGGRGRGMNGTHRPDGTWIGPREITPPASIVEVAGAIRCALGLAVDGDHGTDDLPRAYSNEEAAVLAERLRKLGYLE